MATDSSVIGGIAGRYASALYDLADEAQVLDAVADDVRGLLQALADSPELTKLVRSPLIERDVQGRAMAAVLEKAGVQDLLRRFTGVVTNNGRLFVLPEMAKGYLAELSRRRGEVTAEVTAASEIDDEQKQAIIAALKPYAGDKVTLDVNVDPSLIGGLVVRVGSRMIDSSIRSKLQRLQLAMKGAG